MPDLSRWQPSDPWTGSDGRVFALDPRPANDLDLSFESDLALSTIIARNGAEARLAALARDCLGCLLPQAGRASFGDKADLVWSGPRQWLAVARRDRMPPDLAARFDGAAAVTDQSDSRAIVRLSGGAARTVLAKGLAIDLHPRVFSAGSAAMTKLVHVGVQIWQVDDRPSFMIAIPRSYAASFWSWLATAAAMTGAS